MPSASKIDGRVVIDAGRALLEQRSDQHESAAAWPAAASFSVVGPGMGSARSNSAWIFALAEILGLEKFGQADDLRASRRQPRARGRWRLLQILCRGRTAVTSAPEPTLNFLAARSWLLRVNEQIEYTVLDGVVGYLAAF